ncbi:MAG: tetratricopeptide repeat protein [Deltaproteobacteria bacterium]|nr:tetratricopeptide repeat protein [Deltaproteobacteria bacterium]
MAINREKVRAAAQKHIQKGQFEKAIKEYKQLVEDDPKDVRTILKLGDLQTRAGQNENATNTYIRVANFYSEQGFFLKAVAVYKQILKIDDSIIDVNIKLAELYQQLGLLSDANNQFRHLAVLLEQQNRINECADVLRKMVDLDVENVAVRIKLAEIFAKQNKLEDARNELAYAANVFKQQRRVDEWAKVAERMLSFHPSDIETTRALADIYIQKGDARRALAKLQVCFKHDPKDTVTLELLGSAFKELQQIQKTIAVYKELARIYEENNDERALDIVKKILDLAPDDSEAQHALARYQKQQYVSAHSQYDEVFIENEVGQAEHGHDTNLNAASTDATIVGTTGENVIARDSESSTQETINQLLVEADIYIKYGLLPKAIDYIKQVLNIDPHNREAQEKHKLLLLETGDTAGATTQLWDMAQTSISHNNIAQACSDLEELLQLDANNNQAQQLLQQLASGASVTNEIAASTTLSDNLIDDEIEIDTSLENEKSGDSAISHENVPQVILSGNTGRHRLSREFASESVDIDLDNDTENDQHVEPTPVVTNSIEVTPKIPDEVISPPSIDKPAKKITPTPEATSKSSANVDLEDIDALLASAVPQKNKIKIKSAVPTPDTKNIHEDEAANILPSKSTTNNDLTISASDTATAISSSSSVATDTEDTLDEEINEVRFFVQQGLEEEAREALINLMYNNPGHSKIKELAIEIDSAFDNSQEDSQNDLQTSAPDSAVLANPEVISEPAIPNTDTTPEYTATIDDDNQDFAAVHIEHIDLADELESDFAAAATSDFHDEILDVFDEFKRGVAEQVAESDHETHYDLGIAYKEMGLLDDAIREFNIAARSSIRAVGALTMVGMCYLERGDSVAALKYWQDILNSPAITENDALALRYGIARSFEDADRQNDALKFYKNLYASNPNYSDVGERIQNLQAQGANITNSSTELDDLLAEIPENQQKPDNADPKISYI